MSDPDIAEVTVRFSRSPGAPPVHAGDVVAWVDSLMRGRGEPDGPNSLRYSTPRVVAVAVLEKSS